MDVPLGEVEETYAVAVASLTGNQNVVDAVAKRTGRDGTSLHVILDDADDRAEAAEDDRSQQEASDEDDSNDSSSSDDEESFEDEESLFFKYNFSKAVSQ